MFVTDPRDLFDCAQFLRYQGRVPSDIQFFHTELACKYKMSSMQAALGLAQLERIDELGQKKRDISAMYRDAFADVDGITVQRPAEGYEKQLVDDPFFLGSRIWKEQDRGRAFNAPRRRGCAAVFSYTEFAAGVR
jgi:dTDP-4-amino-4,6-dideoxygalactose transaminase